MHACLLSVCMLKEFQPSRSRLIQKQIYLDVNSAFIVNLINRAPIPPCEADFTHIGHFWHRYLRFISSHLLCHHDSVTENWWKSNYLQLGAWAELHLPKDLEANSCSMFVFLFFLFECILVMKFYSKWSKTTQSTNVPLLKKEMAESWSYSSSPWKRTCSNWI